jgi:hypothetical protein
VLFGGAQELEAFLRDLTGVATHIGAAVQAKPDESTRDVKKYGNDN